MLTQLFLNRSIQTHGKEGHNPIEDAQAAMSLVNLKLEKGLSFGDVVLGRGLFIGYNIIGCLKKTANFVIICRCLNDD